MISGRHLIQVKSVSQKDGQGKKIRISNYTVEQELARRRRRRRRTKRRMEEKCVFLREKKRKVFFLPSFFCLPSFPVSSFSSVIQSSVSASALTKDFHSQLRWMERCSSVCRHKSNPTTLLACLRYHRTINVSKNPRNARGLQSIVPFTLQRRIFISM